MEEKIKSKKEKEVVETNETISCLRNEKVKVEFIAKPSSLVTNPKHVLYGNMADSVTLTLVVPKLSSGVYVNVLTDAEKSFLEDYMGLEYNALSIYKKENNFWDCSNEQGINKVVLNKFNNYLDLSNPHDYIKYKILLANSNIVAPSYETLKKSPKATYKFVIVSDGEKNKVSKSALDVKLACYKEYGKIEDDVKLLRVLVETLDGRPFGDSTDIEFLQTECDKLIVNNPSKFLEAIKDPYLKTKALIKDAVSEGLIYTQSGMYYLTETKSPLCEPNEDSTLATTAKYLNSAKHQGILFALQAKLNK